MNTEEMKQRLIDEVSKMDRQWRRLPELITSGQLQRASNGWYTFSDHRLLDEIGAIVSAFRLGTAGNPHRIQIPRRTQQFDSLFSRCITQQLRKPAEA